MNIALRRAASSYAFGTHTFTDYTSVEISGGGGSWEIECEVEFTATRGERPSFDDPGSASERELVSIRPVKFGLNGNGFRSTIPIYLECPDWLTAALRDCVDLDALNADFSDI